MNTEIKDTEIRIVGGEEAQPPKPRWPWFVGGGLLVLAAVLVGWLLLRPKAPLPQPSDPSEEEVEEVGNLVPDLPPCVIVADTLVDSLSFRILTPLNAVAELHVGPIDTSDADILMALQAADLRRDNGRIVGAFVLQGKPLSWGLSKRGYCAIIDGHLSIGTADNSPLFEQATETGGDFFRQYSAVAEGQPVENSPENQAFRRALCMLGGRACVVCSHSRMTMDAFSQSLVALGVREAIFLVGGSADGWVRPSEGPLLRLGAPPSKHKAYLNYLLFRSL